MLRALTLTTLIWTSGVTAGALSPDTRLSLEVGYPTAEPGCTHRFEGLVEKGDLARFQSVAPDPQAVVCLNSPGGSFLEGIRIAEFLQTSRIGTRIEASTRCESACSIIFMGGSTLAADHEIDDWPTGFRPWRTMHPTARLGFHAPKLNVAQGQFSEATVARAYDAALLTISEFVRRLPAFHPDLFARMISTPHDQMYWIETVDQAGQFGISVGPVPRPEAPTDPQRIHACAHFWAWAEEVSVTFYADRIPAARVDGGTVVLGDSGLECDFTRNPTGRTTWAQWDIAVPDWAFHPGDTPLRDLPR